MMIMIMLMMMANSVSTYYVLVLLQNILPTLSHYHSIYTTILGGRYYY